MNKITFALIACAWIGCSSNNNNPPPQDLAVAPDLASAGAPDCATYCTAIMANCTGTNQQYTTVDNCMNVCKAIPVGTAADQSGNTLGCRIYHANFAKNDPVTHCPHAGPGGNGVCGADCAGYCQIALMYCTGANQIYTSPQDCMTTCMSFPDTLRFNVNDATVQASNSQACLLYHSQEASSNPPDHCLGDLQKGDGGIKSVTCM
jgi:hypothetical protein